MQWKLRTVVVPVADLDRAIGFYRDKVGFPLDHDTRPNEHVRVIQFTIPGAETTITMLSGLGGGGAAPGSLKGMQLTVSDIDAAHAELTGRGVPVSEIRHLGENGWQPGKGGQWNSFLFFDDPDGNSWSVQEAPADGDS